MRKKVPNRRKMNPSSSYGTAIGNLTSQAGSNLNLSNFDNYVTKELKLDKYIRYVDDIVIISDSKEKLRKVLPLIIEKLKETHQNISKKKTKIDTAYHGVQFLGKISYPYGYQKAKKEVIIRTYQKGMKIEFEDINNLLAKTNSQIGSLKKYNCRKVIYNYSKILQKRTSEFIELDNKIIKFKEIENEYIT